MSFGLLRVPLSLGIYFCVGFSQYPDTWLLTQSCHLTHQCVVTTIVVLAVYLELLAYSLCVLTINVKFVMYLALLSDSLSIRFTFIICGTHIYCHSNSLLIFIVVYTGYSDLLSDSLSILLTGLFVTHWVLIYLPLYSHGTHAICLSQSVLT